MTDDGWADGVAGKRKGKGKAARRDAQLQRLAATGDAGAERRERTRDATGRAAAVAPSAARWRVPSDGPALTSVVVDVVADLLRLDPRTSLRGRGGDELRSLAGHVADLIGVGAVLPSGRSLVELVTEDAGLTAQLRPELDLDALLSGDPIAGDRHDRTVRVADALLTRASAHRDGAIDLHALAAPVGTTRHDHADELETTLVVALDGVHVPAGPDPAVTVVSGGWVGAGPVELFLGAARGALTGRVADVAGAGLVTWLTAVAAGREDGRWFALEQLFPVDGSGLVQEAAARTGSDHPDVAGGALARLIALRYPL